MSLLPPSAYAAAPRPGRKRRTLGPLIVSVLLLGLLAGGGYFLMKRVFGEIHAPEPQVCVASFEGRRAALDPEQAHFAAIVAGVAVHKKLGIRGATIGLATAMQESSLRNLDYGDRDSVGLFQQRPSQGWGTADQVQDPYYASDAFYQALTKLENWETGDINDIAQAVQHSGVPDGYRKRVPDAATWAAALTGAPGSTVSCVDRSNGKGDAEGLARIYKDTFGAHASTDSAASTVTIEADSAETAWMYAMHAVANTRGMGVTRVTTGNQEWSMSGERQSAWGQTETPAQATTVVIALRGTS